MKLDIFKDDIAMRLYGMTRKDAWERGICIQCKQAPQYYSKNGEAEYKVSALCEFCWDTITAENICINCGKPESWHKYGKTECKKPDYGLLPGEE